jgi:hypothetical protein
MVWVTGTIWDSYGIRSLPDWNQPGEFAKCLVLPPSGTYQFLELESKSAGGSRKTKNRSVNL